MKQRLWVIPALLTAFMIFASQGNPNASRVPPSRVPPMIMDIQLASYDDDPEPYIIDFIKSKEKLDVQKIRVVGAPDTDDVFYVAYRTKAGTRCRNLWLVRISLGGDMAQGLARKVACEQYSGTSGQKRLTIPYSASDWPNE